MNHQELLMVGCIVYKDYLIKSVLNGTNCKNALKKIICESFWMICIYLGIFCVHICQSTKIQ